jgi:hypothetical protein
MRIGAPPYTPVILSGIISSDEEMRNCPTGEIQRRNLTPLALREIALGLSTISA